MHSGVRQYISTANSLSFLRLVLVPVLLWLAWEGERSAFLIVVVVSFLTDAVDGTLARWFKQESSLGARLDSYGDLANYVCLALGGWWLWPDVIRAEAPFIVAVVASIAIPSFAGVIKFHRSPSYHSWGAKLSAVLVGASAIAMFAGLSPWPFRLTTPILVLSALDDLAITLILKEWRPNVHSFVHALRVRRSPKSHHPLN